MYKYNYSIDSYIIRIKFNVNVLKNRKYKRFIKFIRNKKMFNWVIIKVLLI